MGRDSSRPPPARGRVRTAVVASAFAVACGNAPPQPQATVAISSAAAPTPSAAAATLAPVVHAGDDWTTYMGDAQRSGVGPTTPQATRVHRTWTAAVDGDVYGAPLVLGASVVVATERDTVYALDSTTGVARWHTHLGDPVPVRSLVCGNIDPNGVTGTPVIDAASGTVFVVAMLDAPIRHELYALRVSDGAVLWHHAADPPGADPRIHQQRGALSLVGGRVYFAYGGFTGDCGQYHGWILASAADGSGSVHGWQVPSSSQGGIWAPPGQAISRDGDVWVATGNSETVKADRNLYDWGNAVIRLDAGLTAPADRWVVSTWAALNSSDTDLGSESPSLVGDNLAFIAGKPGIGYLLRAGRLGDFGGEAFSEQACVTGGPTQGAFGGAAVFGAMVYLPCKDGLAGIRVDPSAPSFSVLWRASTGANSPVVAYGLVWTVSADPAGYRQDWMGTLVGLDPQSGAERVRVALGATPHFPTPAASRGSMYVAGRGTVYAVSVG